MIIEFSYHAKARIKERRISKALIEKALIKFQKIVDLGERKFMCYHKIKDATLVVVFFKQREYIKVITAYYENNL